MFQVFVEWQAGNLGDSLGAIGKTSGTKRSGRMGPQEYFLICKVSCGKRGMEVA